HTYTHAHIHTKNPLPHSHTCSHILTPLRYKINVVFQRYRAGCSILSLALLLAEEEEGHSNLTHTHTHTHTCTHKHSHAHMYVSLPFGLAPSNGRPQFLPVYLERSSGLPIRGVIDHHSGQIGEVQAVDVIILHLQEGQDAHLLCAEMCVHTHSHTIDTPNAQKHTLTRFIVEVHGHRFHP